MCCLPTYILTNDDLFHLFSFSMSHAIISSLTHRNTNSFKICVYTAKYVAPIQNRKIFIKHVYILTSIYYIYSTYTRIQNHVGKFN